MPSRSNVRLLAALAVAFGQCALPWPAAAQEALPTFEITVVSDSHSQVELKVSGQAVWVRLIVHNGYLDQFRPKSNQVIQTRYIPLFADSGTLGPYFPRDREEQQRAPALAITLYAGSDVDTHWRIWHSLTEETLQASGLIAAPYGEALLKIEIDRMRARDLFFIPPNARGVLDLRKVLWDHFDVYVPKPQRQGRELKNLYFECIGPKGQRDNPGHVCQARAEYDRLVVRADIRRERLATGSRTFERELKQLLDRFRVN